MTKGVKRFLLLDLRDLVNRLLNPILLLLDLFVMQIKLFFKFIFEIINVALELFIMVIDDIPLVVD